jgi:cyclin-dependent kinase 14
MIFILLPKGFYRPRKLGLSFPRLYDIVEGEAISSALLQLNPDNRIGAAEAIKHPYFNQLPKKLYELPDGESSNNRLKIKWN